MTAEITNPDALYPLGIVAALLIIAVVVGILDHRDNRRNRP